MHFSDTVLLFSLLYRFILVRDEYALFHIELDFEMTEFYVSVSDYVSWSVLLVDH